MARFLQRILTTISAPADSCYIENLAGVSLENSSFHVMSQKQQNLSACKYLIGKVSDIFRLHILNPICTVQQLFCQLSLKSSLKHYFLPEHPI